MDEIENKEEIAEETAEETAAETAEEEGKKSDNDKIRASFLLLIAVLLIITTAAITFLVCTKIYNKKIDEIRNCKVVFDKNTTDSEVVAKFQDILDFIEESFSLEYDPDKLVEGAIEGMVNALDDPYSYYIKPGKYSDFDEYITGKYVGIGILYERRDDGLKIVTVYGDTPAESAGLVSGDIVTHIGGRGTTDMNDDEISSNFTTEGAKVNLTVRRNDGSLEDVIVTVLALTRQTVFIADEDNSICNIRISQFTETTADEFAEALNHAESTGAKGIILDLRSNGGGYASAACKIADIILGEGIIAYSENKNGDRKEEYKSDASCIGLPIVLLVNGDTASASELLSGAFRDYKRGVIIGTKTYGKALGQLNRSYSSDGSGIVLTVTKFYTPSGECIHGVGITPDIIIEDENEQLNAARESLLKEING